MDTIDYQTPQNTTPAGSTAVVFWTAFLVAAIAGVAIASVLDEAVYHYIMGHYPDGGVTIISTAGIPMSAIAAAITRSIRKPKRTGWVFAACCGLIASPIMVVALYAFF